MNTPRLDVMDERIVEILAAWGVPYSYGAGVPRDGIASWPEGVAGAHGGVGWDCSGFAQAVLVRLGKIPPDAKDRSSAGLYVTALPISNSATLGDLAFYGHPGAPEHVMVYLGNGAVIGARNGDHTTNADNPKAYVSVLPVNYRPDFLGFGRVNEVNHGA